VFWGLKRRVVVHLVIVALLALPALIVTVSGWETQSSALFWLKLKFNSLENETIDHRIIYYRRAEVNPEIVFLTIDIASVSVDASNAETIAASRSLSLMFANGFPYPREVYADICERLIQAGAKVVAFDIFFPKPTSYDPSFASVLDKYHDKIVIGMNFSDDFEHGRASTLTLPSSTLIPSQDPFDSRLGFLNFWPDENGVVRSAQYRSNAEYVNQLDGAEKLPKFYSLVGRAVQKGGHENLLPDDLNPRVIRFTNLTKIPTFSLYKIFEPHVWEQTFHNGDFFRDKIVLVGPKGDWFKDQLYTPLDQMNGAEIHVNAMNALLQNDFLHPVSRSTTFLLILAAAFSAFLLAMGIASIAWRFAAALVFFGGYVELLIWAYDSPGWLLPAVGPLGVFCGATGLGYIYDFVLTQMEKLQMRATFERYTSPNVAKYLLDHSSTYQEMLAGTRKPVTVLFSDVRGFTTKTEEAAAQGRSQHHIAKLNEYLTRMVSCVFRYDGSLDKFIGDAVMAVWGNTPYNFGPKEDAVRAVRSALAMMTELRELNRGWEAKGEETWQIGIGLNHGDAIVGDMGSQQRKEFAVIGDAVNLASRLESLTKEYQVDILIGESVVALIRDEFHLRSVDLVQVKGKTQAVEAFTVLGEKTEALTPERQKFLSGYEEGVRTFRIREFVRAKELFVEALALEPDDRLAKEYLANCEEFLLHPPDASWTGVRVMTKK